MWDSAGVDFFPDLIQARGVIGQARACSIYALRPAN